MVVLQEFLFNFKKNVYLNKKVNCLEEVRLYFAFLCWTKTCHAAALERVVKSNWLVNKKAGGVSICQILDEDHCFGSTGKAVHE